MRLYLGACFIHWGFLLIGIKTGDQVDISWSGEDYNFRILKPSPKEKEWTLPIVPPLKT